MSGLSYKDSGVDLDKYEQAMQKLPPLMKRTHSSRVMELTGGFAGLFRLNGETAYTDPVLVSGTDGVGTKIKVAMLSQTYNTIGIDLVAMCVNDCLCLGAEPLFFLDYLALGKDNPPLIADLVEGVSEGCLQAGASLIAGETAIMPDVYGEENFDLAGFCVGVVERERLIDGTQIEAGDVLIGLPSNGFHSNGYSLVRKVVFDHAGLTIDSSVDELGKTVAEVLLTPTKIYAAETVAAMALNDDTSAVTGIAHITGGGLAENLERILPEGVRAQLDRNSWTAPACFDWVQKLGNVDPAEMDRVFNMGVGMVFCVRANQADQLEAAFASAGAESFRLGEIQSGERGVTLN
ncbi:phosphoribosylformylglycinamidine cyclo-ligase [Planctomycetaceae bacterium]|nr:phosphoribosylformylglycinamidine cyclo-ligase [bacterium]MDC0273992.1 phosphoribosylformylglycinamidine cyclo-ligase [Planctomycetaceae bacterium]